MATEFENGREFDPLLRTDPDPLFGDVPLSGGFLFFALRQVF